MSDATEDASASQDEQEDATSSPPAPTWTEESLIDAIDAGRWDALRRVLRTPPPAPPRSVGGGGGGGGPSRNDAATDEGDDDRRYFGPSLRCACMSRRIPPDVVSSMLRLADLDVLFPPRPPSSPFHPRATTHLHNAAGFGRDSTVSAVLAALGPEKSSDEARRLSYGGLIPLEEAWLGYLRSNRSAAEATARVRQMASVGDFGEFHRSHRHAELRELWNKTTALLLAAEGRCLGGIGPDGPLWDGRQWRAVHAAAGCGRVGGRGGSMMGSSRYGGGSGSAAASCFSSNELQTHCPSAILWFALKLYPDQASQRDEFGDLPLHVAASNPVHHGLDLRLRPGDAEDPDGTVRAALRAMNRPAAAALLEAQPAAARRADRAGRVPLNLALEGYDRWAAACRARSLMGGGRWGVGGGGGGGSGTDGRPPRSWLEKPDPSLWTGVVMDLARAAPEALAARDVRTRLHPFMLAAAVRSAPLDAAYLLLRANPAMVKGGIVATRQERYLEGKVRALKRERDGHVAELEELRAKVARLEKKSSPGK